MQLAGWRVGENNTKPKQKVKTQPPGEMLSLTFFFCFIDINLRVF